MKKMIKRNKIGIDIDGVLADFIVPFLEYCNGRFGISYKKEEVSSFYFLDSIGFPEEKSLKTYNDFYNSELFETITPIEGSFNGVLKLFQKRYRLNLVTARPDSLKEKTFLWLWKNYPNIFEQVNFTNGSKKSDFCLRNSISAMIEDHADYANDCAEKGIETFLITQPWNFLETLHPGVRRVKDWSEIVERLE